MTVIGITINDVLRDFSNKFIQIYNHHYNFERIDLDNDIPNLGVDFEGIEYVKTRKTKNFIYPDNFNPYNLIQYFDNEEEMNDFLYSEAIFDIFGFASQTYKDCCLELNIIAETLKQEGFELIVLSDDKVIGRSATLHFLSKSRCELSKIIFVNSKDEYFNHCDYLVTTDPSLLYKRTIKIEKEYNKNTSSEGFTIKQINELPKIIEKLK